MTICGIELTQEEQALVEQIDFNLPPGRRDAESWRLASLAAGRLMHSLLGRGAIPEIRMRFFTDPEFNIRGRGKSRAQMFEANGTHGAAIYRHGNFLKYLRYFLYGPRSASRSHPRISTESCGVWVRHVQRHCPARKGGAGPDTGAWARFRRSNGRVFQAGAGMRTRFEWGSIYSQCGDEGTLTRCPKPHSIQTMQVVPFACPK